MYDNRSTKILALFFQKINYWENVKFEMLFLENFFWISNLMANLKLGIIKGAKSLSVHIEYSFKLTHASVRCRFCSIYSTSNLVQCIGKQNQLVNFKTAAVCFYGLKYHYITYEVPQYFIFTSLKTCVQWYHYMFLK